jgi:HEAT repeats
MTLRRRMRWMLLSWLALQLAASPVLGDSNTNGSSEASEGSAALKEDRVDQLAAQLTRPSSNEKAKLSAIAALARTGDRRAVKPLTGALQDGNPTVRALAAAALGKLGQKSAMPALRQAQNDSSETVRERVADAIASISRANGLAAQTASTTAGFGKQARITEQSPDLYVVFKSFNDDSPGRSEKKERLTNAEVVRAAMTTELRSAPLVTAVANEAKRLNLNPRVVDASVVKMKLRTKGNMLELETELRLAISDDSGKMLSFLSGGAKVSVPKKGFNWSYLPQLRKEALENAVRGLFGKLITHLRTTIAA